MADNEHPLHGFLSDRVPEGLQVELTDSQAIRLAYFFKMKFDVQNIRSLLNVINVIENQKEIIDVADFNKTEKILIRQSLWVNSIVTYAKLFNDKTNDNACVRHIRLQKKQCYKNASADILNMHDKLIEIRNLCISHGVENEQEHIIPYMLLTEINNSGEVSGKFGVNSINPISYSPTDLKIFEEILSNLSIFIETKLDNITDILFEKYKDVSAQTWFELAIKKGKL